MSDARRRPSLKTRLASALLALGEIPYDDAKLMTAHQMISLYQDDHSILHAIEVNEHFSNFTPRLIVPHRRKSAKDTAIVAKSRRIEAAHEDFRRRVLAVEKQPRPQSRLRSRGFDKTKTKKFSGQVVERRR